MALGEEPRSIAHGILDDETYDWLAVVEGMLATGGHPVVVDERTLVDANKLARLATGSDVDHTGSAGLAGLLEPLRDGVAPSASASPSCSREAVRAAPPERSTSMRSFLGRDILSLKDFERADFERVFEVCDELAPLAKNRRNGDLLTDKTL